MQRPKKSEIFSQEPSQSFPIFFHPAASSPSIYILKFEKERRGGEICLVHLPFLLFSHRGLALFSISSEGREREASKIPPRKNTEWLLPSSSPLSPSSSSLIVKAVGGGEGGRGERRRKTMTPLGGGGGRGGGGLGRGRGGKMLFTCCSSLVLPHTYIRKYRDIIS